MEEIFHRVDEFNFDLTITITDPKMYTKPWMPLKNFRLGMNSPDFRYSGDDLLRLRSRRLFNPLLHNVVPTATDK